MTDPQEFTGVQKEEQKLPRHVVRYLGITSELNNAVKQKDKAEILQQQELLREFYGTLNLKQREELEKFTEQELMGKVIEDQRGWFHRNFVRLIHVPHRVVGSAAEPVAKLSGETLRLICLTLGWGLGGIVLGFRQAYDGVLNKAA